MKITRNVRSVNPDDSNFPAAPKRNEYLEIQIKFPWILLHNIVFRVFHFKICFAIRNFSQCTMTSCDESIASTTCICFVLSNECNICNTRGFGRRSTIGPSGFVARRFATALTLLFSALAVVGRPYFFRNWSAKQLTQVFAYFHTFNFKSLFLFIGYLNSSFEFNHAYGALLRLKVLKFKF